MIVVLAIVVCVSAAGFAFSAPDESSVVFGWLMFVSAVALAVVVLIDAL